MTYSHEDENRESERRGIERRMGPRRTPGGWRQDPEGRRRSSRRLLSRRNP